MTPYISMATTSGLVDCRMVCLEIDFSQLPIDQMILLAELCCSHLNHWLDDSFITVWHWCSRRIKPQKIYQKLRLNKASFTFTCEADVRSNIVYDTKTFHAYEKKLQDLIATTDFFSCDYPNIIQPYLKQDLTDAQLKRVVLEICNKPGMKNLSQWRTHDARAIFWSCAHEKNPSLCYGHFSFHIALTCLGSKPMDFVDQLVGLLRNVANSFSQVSGRVAVSPLEWPGTCSAHMRYFYELDSGEDSHIQHGTNANEWYPYFYVSGVEWCNLISPLQQTHCPIIQEDVKKYPTIIAETCLCGGIILRLQESIDSFDVDDLIPLKKLMYNSLYPGFTRILKNRFFDLDKYTYLTKPRLQWECLPVFEEEVHVFEDYIEFRHVPKESTRDMLQAEQ